MIYKSLHKLVRKISYAEIGNYFLANPMRLLISQQANSYRQAKARENNCGYEPFSKKN